VGTKTSLAESKKRFRTKVAMKVIFLDIDGVLNCSKTANPRKLPYVVDKKLLSRFLRLLARTRAKVVLTSSWRLDPVGLLAAKYWRIPFLDVCPDMPRSARRKEVLRWLAAHPNVSRYVVIDDEDDELDDLPLFQPSARHGLTMDTMDIVRGVEKFLSGKTNETMRANVIQRLGQISTLCSSAAKAECDSMFNAHVVTGVRFGSPQTMASAAGSPSRH
jgi:hypothetical protein